MAFKNPFKAHRTRFLERFFNHPDGQDWYVFPDKRRIEWLIGTVVICVYFAGFLFFGLKYTFSLEQPAELKLLTYIVVLLLVGVRVISKVTKQEAVWSWVNGCVGLIFIPVVAAYVFKVAFLQPYAMYLYTVAAGVVIYLFIDYLFMALASKAWTAGLMLALSGVFALFLLPQFVMFSGVAAQVNSPFMVKVTHALGGAKATRKMIGIEFQGKAMGVNAADLACAWGSFKALDTLAEYGVKPSSNYCLYRILGQLDTDKPDVIERFKTAYPKYVSDNIVSQHFPLAPPMVYVAQTCRFADNGITEYFASHASDINVIYHQADGYKFTAIDIAGHRKCDGNHKIFSKYGAKPYKAIKQGL